MVAKGRPKEGGLALLSGGDVRGASTALVQGGEWEAGLALLEAAAADNKAADKAADQSVDQGELQRVAYAAAQSLREAGDGRGAARVYLDYCHDLEEAVLCSSSSSRVERLGLGEMRGEGRE